MPEPAETDRLPEEWPPLFPLVSGYMISALISAALHFKLGDRLGDGARTSESLAAETGTHEPSLARLLRALASVGVLEEVEPGRFALTPAGQPLRSDAAGPMYSSAIMFCDETRWRAWGALPYSVRTGKPAFDEVIGMGYFTHLARNPELSRHVNEAMSQATQGIAAEIVQEYDFSPFSTVIDVGGGDGTLLAAILGANPRLRGMVYDSPAGVDAAPRTLKTAGVAGRGEIQTGDFFTSVPEGGDLYVLKSILHDWDDDRCTVILRNCRRAMPVGSRLLIVEIVLPPQVGPSAPPFGYMSDVNMLVVHGGKERTEAGFRTLLAGSGFELTSVACLPGPARMSVLSASPV